MKYILSLIISGALVVSGFGQTRNVLVGTNNAVVQPTNFWSADASNARTGLGLGTAATNPATAFQPADSDLNALASNNGGSLTNLQSTNIVGIIPASNIATVNFSNLGGTLAISSGGTGATNAGGARTNLSLGWSALTNTNSATSLLGHTTNGTVVYTGPNFLRFTNSVQFEVLTVANQLFMGDASGLFIDGDASIFLGSALTKSNFRNELGLGWSALTNSNSATSLLGFTTNGQVVASTGTNVLTFTNTVRISGGQAFFPDGTTNFVGIAIGATNTGLAYGGIIQGQLGLVDGGKLMALIDNNTGVRFYGPLVFNSDVEQTRTNLGLGWPALTNTNAEGFNTSLYGSGTNPVLYNTNGDVVSPTNFWQVAPISTTVQYQTNVTGTSTNAATNSRNLFLFSLATSVSGVTNTVTLPTNPATTFEGDRATIIHLAQTTNAVTAIRQLGATTNLITLNQLDEAVLLMYRSGAWTLADNISYVEPIFFSGTNAAANAAASRTNLGLPLTALTNTNADTFRTAINLGTNNNPKFAGLMITNVPSGSDFVSITPAGVIVSDGTTNSTGIAFGEVYFSGSTAASSTRTNLGIPLPALTNTNNADFQAAVFATNSNPTNAGNFNNHVAWMEVTVQTNGSNVSFRVPLYK
jgi:hypothetical protein